MLAAQERRLDHIFKALGDPTRRRMLSRLGSSEQSVSELAQPFRMTLAAASKHIRVLEQAGLVRRLKRGRTHYCTLTPRPLADAYSWLGDYRRMWEEQFDKLDAYLARRNRKGADDARALSAIR